MKQRRVVRAIGSGTCHTIEVDDDDLVWHGVFGSTGRALRQLGSTVDCGVHFPKHKVVVVMTSARGICRACRHITGVTGVQDGELVHA